MPQRRSIQYPDYYTFTNAANPLTIETYDGGGQTTHPDIYDFKTNSFQGYRFWMVNTPYPSLNSAYENPSIWCSNDGTNWIIPNGLTNPIVAYPGNSTYNSDNSITYDTNLSKLRVYYRVTGGGSDSFRMIESSDGVNWVNDQQVIDLSSYGYECLSPSIYYDNGSGTYYLWTYHHGGCSGWFIELYRFSSTDGINWIGPTICTIDNPTGYWLWHLNLKRFDDSFVGVTSVFPKSGNCASGQVVCLIRSLDRNGLKFKVSDKPILGLGASNAWDNKSLYQSCMINVDGVWKLWYTGILGSASKLGLSTYAP